MVREIITPRSSEYMVQIPQEYIDKKVEILVLPFSHVIDRDIKQSSDIFQKTAGILVSQNIDPISWQNEIRGEWDR